VTPVSLVEKVATLPQTARRKNSRAATIVEAPVISNMSVLKRKPNPLDLGVLSAVDVEIVVDVVREVGVLIAVGVEIVVVPVELAISAVVRVISRENAPIILNKRG
jgi:hypothetical protein